MDLIQRRTFVFFRHPFIVLVQKKHFRVNGSFPENLLPSYLQELSIIVYQSDACRKTMLI